MEFEQIITLIDHVSESKLTSFEYETETVRVAMERGTVQNVVVSGADMTQNFAPQVVQGAPVASSVMAQTEVAHAEPTGNIVKSPLVGTFYAAPSEDADPYVTKGDTVKKGQVLAIVEAMKLMNDIESDFAGTVAEIYVENGQTVEYGQPLFRIE